MKKPATPVPGGKDSPSLARRVAALLAEGLTPEKLTLSVVLGVCVGVFPVVGATVVLSVMLAAALRLNMVVTQVANQLAGPLQLILFIPLLRAGEILFDAPPLAASPEELVELASVDGERAVRVVATTVGYAIAAWLLVAPLMGSVLYLLLRPLVGRLAPRARS
ncbi:MAG: DUF2062 domain-containing protein [Myxococcota bacterium]